MIVISLGWGVQSFALAAMSALGLLPKVDAAVHADTTYERAETYEFARRWTPWLEERGVGVVTVKAEDGSQERLWDDTGQTMIPLYTISDNDASHGQLRRSCTQRWKIAPQRRWISAELEYLGLEKQPGIVEQWFGITLDEIQRVRLSDVKYIANVYPFVEVLDHPWTRGMVIRWLLDNGLEVPVKSSCVFCPFHDRATWREIKLSDNGDWEKAIAVDEAIRHKRLGYLCYLTADRKPLTECDFRNLEDLGQMALWGEECSGYCFV